MKEFMEEFTKRMNMISTIDGKTKEIFTQLNENMKVICETNSLAYTFSNKEDVFQLCVNGYEIFIIFDKNPAFPTPRDGETYLNKNIEFLCGSIRIYAKSEVLGNKLILIKRLFVNYEGKVSRQNNDRISYEESIDFKQMAEQIIKRALQIDYGVYHLGRNEIFDIHPTDINIARAIGFNA